METSLIIKYACIILFFSTWISCEQGGDNPEKQENGIKIENLQTRLRIVEPDSIGSSEVEYLWRANTRNIIINYPPYHSYYGYTYFGYPDENGEILLCRVNNFPDSV